MIIAIWPHTGTYLLMPDSRYQVNNIAPTIAWSDMGLKTWGDRAKSQPMLDKTPIGRFVEPWEIANMVVFLCSDGCTMCVGQTICVDGGHTCL